MFIRTTALLAFSLGAMVALAADRPEIDMTAGTWVLRVDKSVYHAGPAPKSQTRLYEPSSEGLKETITTIGADGNTTTVIFPAIYDGKDYPVTGSSQFDAIAMTRVNERIVESVLKHGEKTIASARRVISEDGKTMTITVRTPDEGITVQAVYEKQ